MKHLQEALEALGDDTYVKIEGNKIIFWVQDGPIQEKVESGKMIGINGLQASDMLDFVKHLFVSLNKAYPHEQNILTINVLNVALHAQKLRTKDREARKVEGKNEV